MRIVVLAVVFMGCLSQVCASPGIDAAQGVWRDYFSDLAGLSYNKQGTRSYPGGFTVSSSPVSWSQPNHESGDWERFSSPVSSGMQSEPTLYIENAGTSMEVLTLWSRYCVPSAFFGVYTPISVYSIMAKCLPAAAGDVCSLGLIQSQTENGKIVTGWIINVPYQEGIAASGAYWGYKSPGVTWLSESIDSFYNLPISFGAAETLLVPGYPYNVAFVAAVNLYDGPGSTATNHSGYAVDYMELRLVDRAHDAVHSSLVVQEKDFGAKTITTNFDDMVPLTLEVNPLPSVPGAVWDFQVVSKVDVGTTPSHRHPTYLGPVFVTGAKGRYESPTLDTLSSQTKWLDLSWDLYQSTRFIDTSLPIGNPIAPVQITYEVRTPDSTTVSIPSTAPAADGKIDMTFVLNSSTPIQDGSSGPVSGRYFKYWLDLYSRSAAGSLDGDLAPLPKTHWGGFRPFVRRITARYIPAAAMAVSAAIAPPGVKKWGNVKYSVFKPGTSTVQVDVLSESGTVLVSDVKSGSSVASIDPYAYPRLKLRGTLSCDPVDTSLRPVLEHWEISWEPLPEIVEVRCNSIRPERGETCSIQIGVPDEGRVRAVIYDVAGQEVRTLIDETMPAQAAIVTWDGRNESGKVVAAGVYFLNVSVPGASKVKRLAVVR